MQCTLAPCRHEPLRLAVSPWGSLGKPGPGISRLRAILFRLPGGRPRGIYCRDEMVCRA